MGHLLPEQEAGTRPKIGMPDCGMHRPPMVQQVGTATVAEKHEVVPVRDGCQNVSYQPIDSDERLIAVRTRRSDARSFAAEALRRMAHRVCGATARPVAADRCTASTLRM